MGNLVLRILFEKIPLLNLLDGKKQIIGKALQFAGALTAVILQFYPALPFISEVNGWIVLASGVIVKYVGELHANAKAVTK